MMERTVHAGLSEWWQRYLDDPIGALTALAVSALRWWPWVAVVGVVALAGVVGVRWAWPLRGQARRARDARVITVLAPAKVDPAGAGALWSNLTGVLRPRWTRLWAGQPHVSWEYAFTDTGTQIRVWVPGVIPPGLVERAIQAAWPGAHTHTTPAPDTEPSTPGGDRRTVSVGGQLRLARPEAVPIRSAFDVDPLRALLGAPLGLAPGETALVQVVARPATGARLRRTRRHARTLATPGGTTGGPPHLGLRLLDLITPGPTPTASGAQGPTDRREALEVSALNRAVVGKQRGAQFETLVRYQVTTTLAPDASPADAAQAKATVRGRAHGLASGTAAYIDHNHYRRRRLWHHRTVVGSRRFGRGDVLSVPELAALAHLPADDHLPGVQRAGARAVAPPPGIAAPSEHAKPLGCADSGEKRPVGLRVADGRHHLHVLGATGSGKSTLLAQLVLADAEAGRGAVVVDPKGDLVTDILTRLPAEMAGKVTVLDADSGMPPPCLNPLDGGDTDTAVDNLVSVFRRVFHAFWGPRTDDVMRAACLTLRAQDGVATLADLPKLLSESSFRDRLLRDISDPVLREFWSSYDQLTDASRVQVTAPLMNKLRAFLLRPFVRDALAAGESTVDLGQVLDGGLCLVRIPKGSLGEDTSRLLGSLVVAHTWQAATARAHQPQSERRDASLLIDECHNFLNLPYPLEDMLAEARGYRLSMTLAHQHLAQLPKDLREGISTNARNKLFFSTGPDDARDLARHVAPQLGEHDLAHLDAFHLAARLVVHGQETTPFTLATSPLPGAVPGRARHLRTTPTAPCEPDRPPVVEGRVVSAQPSDPRRS